MKWFPFCLSLLLTAQGLMAAEKPALPVTVSPERMQQVYEEVCTPCKYGMVLAPDNDRLKFDCPTVFREGKRWYMTYLAYNGKDGKDGRGYETWLAVSDDLLNWETLGRVLPFGTKGWDMNQRGGYVSLIDPTWGGSYRTARHDGKYWMSYIGGDVTGYEQGTLQIGMASTAGKISEAHSWDTRPEPVLSPRDSGNGWWESLTQYKSSVICDPKRSLGASFVMFYNAGGINPVSKVKGERIGIALSDDMEHWKRFEGNPVLNHEGGITGDAQLQRMGDLWVMFYFSAFRPGFKHNAFNNFACSYDLVHWTDWTGEPLIYSSEPYDNMFAHKSCVVKYKGVVYHFYCAVNQDNQRGIALAASRDFGNSPIRFPKTETGTFRPTLDLTGPWESCLTESNQSGFKAPKFQNGRPVEGWTPVLVPHNWDQYYGFRRLKHGNLHGTAWYRKTFEAPMLEPGKRCFLFFEGVGSYGTIWLNGDSIGHHRGGRTTFTLDVTNSLRPGAANELVVKAEHPAYLADLPWICGGCSNESGFSEGSQPLGIFRPVSLVVTDGVRVQPFGVHLWCKPGDLREEGATLQVETTLRNYTDKIRTVEVVSKLVGAYEIQVDRSNQNVTLNPGEEKAFQTKCVLDKAPRLWSPEDPFQYTLITLIKENGKVIDEERTLYGFRTISWPEQATDWKRATKTYDDSLRKPDDKTFRINGKSLFLNGICEYEHQNGMSHAFTQAQIEARIDQMRAAGFNALRDGHQPHNLLYQRLLDKTGMLYWAQFSAHVWYDTPEFRSQFLALLKDWVIEHRNSPSVILWGLQNESSLPGDFAGECCQLIRSLDPTASTERLITTCNGGTGTDWNVVQNWSGTYSGDPGLYGAELKQQLLNGEYGAWRSLGLHTEGGFVRDGVRSENRFCQLMEQKILQADENKDSLCGHFLWLFQSHENPGRTQNDEGVRDIDRLGPFNNKGLFTSWGEPTDAYYLYRANYAKEPMVYLVSHTWTDRWEGPGIKDSIQVYSNCDSVELFNDWNGSSLGVRVQPGRGRCFQWDGANVRFNLLRAIGYRNGVPAASDLILLRNLPKAPGFRILYTQPLQREQISVKPTDLKAQKGWNYLYRVNCGGPDYQDAHGQLWMADRYLPGNDRTQWGSRSWSDRFNGLHPWYGSQRFTSDPISGTCDWPLFQTFRYGMDQLEWHFPVEPGEYLVECYFTEPWYGAGGNLRCDGWRTFDVAVNGKTMLPELDIWRECGHDAALRKSFTVKVDGSGLMLHFPRTLSGQALICGIAIASRNVKQQPAAPGMTVPASLRNSMPEPEPDPRPDFRQAASSAIRTGAWKDTSFNEQPCLLSQNGPFRAEWIVQPGLAGVYNLRFRYRNTSGKELPVRLRITSADGRVFRDDIIRFPDLQDKWKVLSTTTGSAINAGQYRVELTAEQAPGLWLEAMILQ